MTQLQDLFRSIPIEEIRPNPRNPRKHKDNGSFKDLVESIKASGIVEPLIVRPFGQGFQVIAGERRLRAAKEAGLLGVPAIVRDLDDDAAYESMMIENLQREDLTPFEEAESFKSAIGKKGPEAVILLADKLGLPPTYIRQRIRVLTLPPKVLKAWEDGTIDYAHLQQLMRLGPKAMDATTKWLFQQLGWHNVVTIKELTERIDHDSPPLSAAGFSVKTLCVGCASNSTIQNNLFGVQSKTARCLDPECFKKRQTAWIAEHWTEGKIAKKTKTLTAVFQEDVGFGAEKAARFGYMDKPSSKCHTCPNFATILELSGRVAEEQACIGDRSCFKAVTQPKTEKEKKTGTKDPEAPRADWHGSFFRDLFYRPAIEREIDKLDPFGESGLALLVGCAVKGRSSSHVPDEIGTACGLKGNYGTKEFLSALQGMDADQLRKAARAVMKWIVAEGPSREQYNQNGFGLKDRAQVGVLLGIDISKEFAVTKEYLAKKTRAEALAFVKQFKLLDLKDASAMKKGELDKAILALGPKLVGKVPKEVLK